MQRDRVEHAPTGARLDVTSLHGHNGKVFNITLADVPEKKSDFVQARYELDAPKGKTTVVVKITDMLGEEVVVTRKI